MTTPAVITALIEAANEIERLGGDPSRFHKMVWDARRAVEPADALDRERFARAGGDALDSARLDWFLAVQPTADVDGLGHFITAWLTESKSPTGVAGYFVTRGADHRVCIDKHLSGKGVEVEA